MPILIDRRSFLMQAGTLAAGISVARTGRADSAPLRIAILSDTHIGADPRDEFRGFRPHENLRTAVTQATAAPKFDLAVVNGDLARREGRPEDYAQFAALVRPMLDAQPLALTLGNHDNRAQARSTMLSAAGDAAPVENKDVSVLTAGGFRFVFLDSLLVTNIPPGQLGHAQRNWLANYLAGSGNLPTVVFVHHNPDPESDVALVDAAQLLAILRPRRAVKALIFGHTHIYAHDVQDGLHLLNVPAVGYNFADGNPVGWVEAVIRPTGGDFQLHAIAGDTRDNGKITTLKWRV
jgi:Icc protein